MSKQNWVYAEQSGGIFDYQFYVKKVVIDGTPYYFPKNKAVISERLEQKINYCKDESIAIKALKNWFKKNKHLAQNKEFGYE